MKTFKFKWFLPYPWYIFKEFEIRKIWKNHYEIVVNIKEDNKDVEAVIFSWNKDKIYKMFSRWIFEIKEILLF